MLDARFRTGLDRCTAPVGARLARAGVRADHLTAAGMVLAVSSGAVIATGALRGGLVLLVAGALPDLLDGPVARAGRGGTPRGEFFDSVADRVSDGAVLAGLAWFLLHAGNPDLALLPVALLGLSLLVSYERAKAEALGFRAKGGLMERGERVLALVVALAIPAVLVPVLWVMLALTAITAAQRFVRVWRQASAPPDRDPLRVGVPHRTEPSLPPAALPPAALGGELATSPPRWRSGQWRSPRVESRWRAWREEAEARRRASAGAEDAARRLSTPSASGGDALPAPALAASTAASSTGWRWRTGSASARRRWHATGRRRGGAGVDQGGRRRSRTGRKLGWPTSSASS